MYGRDAIELPPERIADYYDVPALCKLFFARIKSSRINY